jgi:AraC-like DNA-binding protein
VPPDATVAITEPTFRARLLNAALRAADASGLDVPALLRAADLDVSSILSDGRVPHGVAERLYGAAARAAHDEAYGLRIGAATDAIDHGELNLLLHMATSAVELLEIQRRFAMFWHDRLSVDWEHADGQLRVCLRFGGLSVSRVVEEAVIAGIVQRARAVGGKDWAPSEAWLTHPAPADAAPYRAFFGCPVRFAQPVLALVLPAAYLSITLPASGVATLVAQSLRHHLEALRPSTDIVGQVERVLRAAHGEKAWSSAAVARELGMSRKTLERRVAESGTTFRAIVNALRYELAKTALSGDVKLASIATALGFSDLRSFTRAFKRWADATPSAYRLRCAGRAR